MLKFKSSSLLFILSTTTVVVLHFLLQIPLGWLAVPISAYIFTLVYGSAYIGSDFFMPVVCSAVTDKKQIALTFDDGPVENNTSLVLDVLRKNNVYAAFFCIGKKMRAQPKLLKRIDEEGHLIANHSYSHHFFFDFFSTKRIQKELEETDAVAEQITGKKIKMFRPPYGVTTPNLAKAVKNAGYSTVGWSVRTMDTVAKEKETLLNKISKLKAGDIILFHDTVELTANKLQLFIDSIREQGYELVRLDKLIKMEAYA